jgi:hypothetical protein
MLVVADRLDVVAVWLTSNVEQPSAVVIDGLKVVAIGIGEIGAVVARVVFVPFTRFSQRSVAGGGPGVVERSHRFMIGGGEGEVEVLGRFPFHDREKLAPSP